MKVFSELKRNLKKDFSGMKAVRTALLGDSATQFLAQALRGMGYELGFDLDIREADFNQIERQIAYPASELYTHKADMLGKFNKRIPEAYPLLAGNERYDFVTMGEAVTLISWPPTTIRMTAATSIPAPRSRSSKPCATRS